MARGEVAEWGDATVCNAVHVGSNPTFASISFLSGGIDTAASLFPDLMQYALLLAACVLAGCAADCGSDWRETGRRDGALGAQQAHVYAARCPGMDSTRYAEGYSAGFAQRPPPNW